MDKYTFKGLTGTANRIFKYGATDGASIAKLFFNAGEFPPPEI